MRVEETGKVEVMLEEGDKNKFKDAFGSFGAIIRFEYEKKSFIFMIFILISVLMVLSLSILPYYIFSDYAFPDTMLEFFLEGFEYIYYLIVFTVCFFFGGIICEEYDYRTGFITFPVINRYKLTLGKFLCNFFMVFCIIGVYYLTLGMAGYIFYGYSIPTEYYASFGVALIFSLSVSGLVTLLSSFMKNVPITIVACLLILLISETVIQLFISNDIEPLYSFNYLSNLIYYILAFPERRYYRFDRGPFQRTEWLTPAIDTGIFMMILYFVVFLTIAMIIFKKRQLK